MTSLLHTLHIAAAIVWLGGMTLMIFAVRPSAITQLQPPQRIPLLAAVLARFFVAVWVSIAVLLATGLGTLLQIGMKNAPLGMHLMLGIGLVMMAIFGHLYFAPFKRLQRAVAAQDWPTGGAQLAQIHKLVVTNFCLGWVAVAAVRWIA
ncbi:MAG: hypothetical protein RLZZ271_108 [Pseudomonadota bacterium]|jgi:uncharacterized membrane protein